MSIYHVYLTTDAQTVAHTPHVYDRLLLEGGRTVWLRTERRLTPGTVEEAAQDSEPRPGEQYLGTVEL